MLNRIVEVKKQEVKALQASLDLDQIRSRKNRFNPLEVFRDASHRVSIIAEVKKASPVNGVLCHSFDPQALARGYAQNGATAISFISDTTFFQGQKECLPQVKLASHLPVLRKDFIIDEVQLYETLHLGADLVLLIAALHDYQSLLSLCEKSRELGLEPLVEVHDEQELERVLDIPVRIIGINNRNLKDFTVDLKTSLKLVESIPEALVKVSESGIRTTQDMQLLEKYGFDAALIGEALVSSPDPAKKLAALVCYREMMSCDPC